MKCHVARDRIASLVDNQLDVFNAFTVRHHIAGCSSCAKARDAALDVRRRIRRDAPRYTIPADLRATLVARHATAPIAPVARPSGRLRWTMAGAAGGALLTIAAFLGGRAIGDWRVEQDLVRTAVDAHTRAILDRDTIQVASSDHHTVKPWLSARLDYSPPVEDHAEEGFALAGARIEGLGGRRVATLVYHHRAHVVDVFVLPRSGSPAGVRTSTVRGFHAIRTQGRDMDWLVVSDVNIERLTEFARSLATDDAGDPKSVPELPPHDPTHAGNGKPAV